MKTPLGVLLTRLCLSLLLFLSSFVIARISRAQEDAGTSLQQTSAAFLGFDTDKALKDEKENLTSLMDAMLASSGELNMVERAELEKLLSEQELGLSGAVKPETAMKIGQLLGAQVIVSSRAFPIGNKIYLVAKIVGVETGRVYGETHAFAKGGDLGEGVMALSQKVGETISSKRDTLVAAPLRQEDVVNLLAAALEGKKLPVVSINLEERHIGATTHDPAAETELAILLKQLGFKLVDKDSSEADIRLQGQAFSEYATTRGKLISVKGRVELKALNREGDTVAVDKEVSTAIDLSEHIAGKAALEASIRKIAQRLIPKIATP